MNDGGHSEPLRQIKQQLLNPIRIARGTKHGMLFARVPQRQAEHDRPAHQFALHHRAGRQ